MSGFIVRGYICLFLKLLGDIFNIHGGDVFRVSMKGLPLLGVSRINPKL